MTLQPGETLGRYQILEPLGTGGMATVYKAYEPSLDRVVALKVIRPGLAEEADFATRFRREAQAVAKLVHPNIVHVHAFDESDGRLYLAMQYLEGGTLKDRLASLPPGVRLPWPEVSALIGQVADALGYAHEQGVVHRDMKPSNVMLTGKGRAVVTDFGIAKILGSAAMTQTGVGIGTPEYMAPEQGQGVHVDQRADVYALGVVAYELLCGRVPFIADTPFAVVAAHMRDPLPLPRTLAPQLPEAAERVLLKALAKDPKQRFATAPELADALGAALAGRATLPTIAPGAPRPQARRVTLSRPTLLGAAAVAVVLVAGGGAALSGAFATARPSAAPATASSPLPTGVPSATPRPPVTSASGTSAAAPPHAIPAKGALFYQAKLDGTNADLPVWNQDAGNTEIRYVSGAIELATKAANAGGFGELNMAARSMYVGEIDITATTALRQGAWFLWRLRGCGNNGQLTLLVYIADEQLELIDNLGPGGAVMDHLTPLIPVPLKNGATHTIAVVASATNVSLYLDEKQVADVPYTRCLNSTRANFGIGSDATGGAAVVRVTGARFYTLPG